MPLALAVVFARSLLVKLREPVAVATQAVNTILLCFIMGTIYWQLPANASDTAFLPPGCRPLLMA